MGIHDFIDFVQRNGQCIYPLQLMDGVKNHSDDDDDECDDECDSAGSARAIIVLVPSTYTKKEIISWPLREFAKFQKIDADYSWDNWGFDKIEGYREILFDEDKWWNQAIWMSPTFKDHYLVNFEPAVYDAFVLGNATAEQLPWGYIANVFRCRNLPTPPTKELALAKILDCGKENLFEYEGLPLEPLPVPQAYLSLYNEIMSRPTFSTFFTYSVKPPPQLSKARLSILVKDNVSLVQPPAGSVNALSLPKLKVYPDFRIGGETTFCVKYDPDEAVFAFTFRPSLSMNVNIQPKYDNMCIYCWVLHRWIGSYTCILHQAIDAQPYKAAAAAMIRSEVVGLSLNLESLRSVEPPPTLNASFTEKGEKYDLTLRQKAFTPQYSEHKAVEDHFWRSPPALPPPPWEI
jgi:hypothetical protein